jgi:tetratricopeptide (TPR) repeat protein
MQRRRRLNARQIQLRREKDAVRFFDDKLAENPYNVRYNHFQAALQQHLGNDQEARARFRHIISIAPSNVMARNDYALLLAEKKEYDDSVREFNRALLINNEQPTLQKNLCAIQGRVGNYNEAHEHAYRALQLNDLDPMNHRNMAKIKDKMGDTKAALEHNRKALELEQRGSKHDTKTIRSAAVQMVIRGDDKRQALDMMDAARAYEGRKFEVITTTRTNELLQKINQLKNVSLADLEKQEKEEKERHANMELVRSGIVSIQDKKKQFKEKKRAEREAQLEAEKDNMPANYQYAS